MPSDEISIEGPCRADPDACEAVLRSLPEWFGIENALLQYAKDAESLPTFVAKRAGQTIGLLTIKRHFQTSAEIHVIAISRNLRAQGIGTRLLAAAEDWLYREGVGILQVKTVSASSSDPMYAHTRHFYTRRGFQPLEEMPALWGEANPCLVMVKFLG